MSALRQADEAPPGGGVEGGLLLFFCQGHLQFPANALGGKIACPHCRGEITLLVKDAAVGGGGGKTPEARPAAADGVLRKPGS